MSDDLPGCTRDTAALCTHSLTDAGLNLHADRGYVGTGSTTPVYGSPAKNTSTTTKEYN